MDTQTFPRLMTRPSARVRMSMKMSIQGVLKRISDLGLALISVNAASDEQ